MSKDLQKIDKKGLNKSNKGKLDLLNINTAALTASLSDLSIPRLFYQLVVFVLDGSGSMTDPGMTGSSKGEEVDYAVRQVINRLFISNNKNSFDINIWAYANESQEILSTTLVTEIDKNMSFNPNKYIEKFDATKLEETLRNVLKITENYLSTNHNKNAQALVIILSDGAIHDHAKSKSLCEKLKSKNNTTISTVFFESKLWKESYREDKLKLLKENLESLASNPDLFKSTLDPEEIRKHMIESISTVSKID